MLFELLHATTLCAFLVLSVYADDSPALHKSCFDNIAVDICGATVKYPYVGSSGCGYPDLKINCDISSYGGRPFMNVSSHIFHVISVNYELASVRLVDREVDGHDCPLPKQNFSLPSSSSGVRYSLSQYSSKLIVFQNCSSVPPFYKPRLLCSQEYYNTTNAPPSYAFYQDEIPKKGYDWYRLCAENVVVPVSNDYKEANYTDAIKVGFYMYWFASDWCENCELSRGRCWSDSTGTGCACKNNKSYNTTCALAPPPPRRQGVPPTPSSALKPQHHKGMGVGLKIGIGVSAGIGGLLLASLLLFCIGVGKPSLRFLHMQNKNESPINVKQFIERYGCLALQRYKYLDIRKMTNSFKDALGRGGFGQVFKGVLRDGRLVAVKVLNESKCDGEDFINEVATIGRTNHVNVVNLVGFCIEGTRRALVYEFMPNGSLERFIFTQKESPTPLTLSWDKLYQISLGIARGLEYLHRGCNTRILHFDIKPHNILLDENFCPKISDFGLAKLYPTRESIVSTVGARGTMGYIAPELYCRTFGNVSHKSDVYSYGMMMLEMIGGRKNIDVTVDNISEIYFPLWIYNRLKQNNDAGNFEELQTGKIFEDEKSKKMTIVALWCIQAHPLDRPSMSKVVEMLEGNTMELEMPPNPSIPRSSSSTSS